MQIFDGLRGSLLSQLHVHHCPIKTIEWGGRDYVLVAANDDGAVLRGTLLRIDRQTCNIHTMRERQDGAVRGLRGGWGGGLRGGWGGDGGVVAFGCISLVAKEELLN